MLRLLPLPVARGAGVSRRPRSGSVGPELPVLAPRPTLLRPTLLRRTLLPLALVPLVLLAGVGPALAERADRTRPMILEGDRQGTLDGQRETMVLEGNVTVSQGTLILRAERVEVRTLPNGFRTAVATGLPGRPASYRQKRDQADESVEGFADRIEFDGRNDTVRFTGNSLVRRLRGGTVADEITGGQITWDNLNEQFTVQGGTATAGNPTGRVRAVLSPAPEASAPPSPAASGALRPARTLPAPGSARP